MADDIESFLALRDDVASPVEPKLVAGPDIAWDQECDVLVVGFGLAGACAAIEAADRGLNVLLIDRFRGGGSSEMSGGASFLQMLPTVSADWMGSRYMRMILTAESTTAGFWWLRRGLTRSMMFSRSSLKMRRV